MEKELHKTAESFVMLVAGSFNGNCEFRDKKIKPVMALFFYLGVPSSITSAL